MNPSPTIQNLFLDVQKAISNILATGSPWLGSWSLGIFSSFGAIVVALGITNEMGNEHHTILQLVWAIKRLLGTVLIFWFMLYYWSSPLPAVGMSVPSLIRAETQAIAKGVTQDAATDLVNQCELLYKNREEPGWSDTAGVWISYVLGGLAILFLQALATAVILFGLIMEAVMVLVGPLFIPMALIPRFDFLFWSWLRSWIGFSLYRVFGAVVVAVCAKILTMGFQQIDYLSLGTQVVLLPYLITLVFLCVIVVASIPMIVHQCVTGVSGSPVNFSAVTAAAVRRS
jgi:hypothetical protein